MELTRLTEDLMAYVPLPPSGDRLWREDACLSVQPGTYSLFGNVSAVRATPDSLESLTETAAAWFADRGRSDFAWFLGPSATPRDIVERLVQQGATVMSQATGMWMDSPPPPAPPGVEVRPVSSAEDLLVFRRIMFGDDETGEISAEQQAELVASNASGWADMQAMGTGRLAFVAYAGGEPVASGGLVLTDQGFAVLSGGATVPAARGRGCYRALLAERWRIAEAAGISRMVIQASEYSAPILARVGFRAGPALTIVRQRVD